VLPELSKLDTRRSRLREMLPGHEKSTAGDGFLWDSNDGPVWLRNRRSSARLRILLLVLATRRRRMRGPPAEVWEQLVLEAVMTLK